jgi:hypothetical protein
MGTECFSGAEYSALSILGMVSVLWCGSDFVSFHGS